MPDLATVSPTTATTALTPPPAPSAPPTDAAKTDKPSRPGVVETLIGRSNAISDQETKSLGEINAKIMQFGDWSAYYFRTVGSLMVERNDSVGFDTDQIHYRGKWRATGGFQDLTAVNSLKASVS